MHVGGKYFILFNIYNLNSKFGDKTLRRPFEAPTTGPNRGLRSGVHLHLHAHLVILSVFTFYTRHATQRFLRLKAAVNDSRSRRGEIRSPR